MLLEYVIVLSIFILGVGLVGILVRREPLILFSSIIIMAASLLVAFAGFSLFWNNEEGTAAIFVILALLIVQVLTTLSVVWVKKE